MEIREYFIQPFCDFYHLPVEKKVVAVALGILAATAAAGVGFLVCPVYAIAGGLSAGVAFTLLATKLIQG